MAGFFPISALAYQVFQRETQIKELQKEFELLGIVSRSGDDASLSREPSPEVKERYNRAYHPMNFVLQSTVVVLLTMLGMSLFFWPPETGPGKLFDANTLQAMRYGFLGAYLFSAQLVYRRYTLKIDTLCQQLL
jgi:hypothetical protein